MPKGHETSEDRSIRQIVDSVRKRRSPAGKYTRDQIDFVRQVAELMQKEGVKFSLRRLHQKVMDYGVASLGFKEFIYKFYVDAGSFVDIREIAHKLGLEFEDVEVPELILEVGDEEETAHEEEKDTTQIL